MKKRVLGFIGNSRGLSPEQKTFLLELLKDKEATFAHCDASFGDYLANDLAKEAGVLTKTFPHVNRAKRFGSKNVDEIDIARPYIERNTKFVLSCNELLICPKEESYDKLKSGLAKFVLNYAKFRDAVYTIVFPDGARVYGGPSVLSADSSAGQ